MGSSCDVAVVHHYYFHIVSEDVVAKRGREKMDTVWVQLHSQKMSPYIRSTQMYSHYHLQTPPKNGTGITPGTIVQNLVSYR